MSVKRTIFSGDSDDQDYVYLSAAAPAVEHPYSQLVNPVESDTADAKGGPGGPGNGGGGGGGGGLVTTYTSGNPAVDDSNEFNIKINFSGTWTAKQQAVVEWAADFWSSIVTADVHDDRDLNNNLVDDIVITVSA